LDHDGSGAGEALINALRNKMIDTFLEALIEIQQIPLHSLKRI
jgi:hypothetical protein